MAEEEINEIRNLISTLDGSNKDDETKFRLNFNRINELISKIKTGLSSVSDSTKKEEIIKTFENDIKSHLTSDAFKKYSSDQKSKIIDSLKTNFNFLTDEVASEEKKSEETNKEIEIDKNIESIAELLDSKIEKFISLINNLSVDDIKGKNSQEKLQNFIISIGEILKLAENIEKSEDFGFAIFKKNLDELKKENALLNNKEIDNKIKTHEIGFQGLDGSLMDDFGKIKKSLIEKFKDDPDLVFYLFDKLEDIIKTPPRTYAFLRGSENEARNLKSKELAEKQKELQELEGKFKNITKYFQNNFTQLKKGDLNEALVKQYLKEAFEGLDGIEGGKIQEVFEKEIKNFDIEMTKIFNLIIAKPLETDAPVYKSAMQFARNVMHIYDLISESYDGVFNAKDGRLGVDVIIILGNPKNDTDEGLNGAWAKRNDDCVLAWKQANEIIPISNQEILSFVRNTQSIADLISNFAKISTKLTEPEGIKDKIKKIINEDSTPQDNKNLSDAISLKKNETENIINQISSSINPPKKAIKEIALKDEELKKIYKKKEKDEEGEIEELVKLNSNISKFSQMLKKIIELLEILKANINSSNDEKAKLKIKDSYDKIIIYYKEIKTFVNELDKEIIPLVEFILKNHDDLMIYFGDYSKEKAGVNTAKTALKKYLNEIKEQLRTLELNNNKISLTGVDSNLIKKSVIKKEIKAIYKEEIKPQIFAMQEKINELKKYVEGIK
ncbi:MAG: hypothetical protein PHN56_03615 [Candidatus Nanoarchaeia archaeon]|nr:hypothetical protein [Candidatus Nanoarchaeia archaeon]